MSAAMVIVGAGEAGIRAALTLRQQQWDGDIIVLGEEASDPYERPPLSKEFLTQEAPQQTPIAGFQQFSEHHIHFQRSVVVNRIDPNSQQVHTQCGQVIAYHKLLIATGASARHLHIPKVPDPSIFVLRTDLDAQKLRERVRPGLNVVIVGGGFIGLELAASMQQLGAIVHVIEREGRLMQRAVPAEIAAVMQQMHEDSGVHLHFKTHIADVNTRHDQRLLTLSNDITIQADLIIAGIGAYPNITLAESAGLEIDNGIRVNEQMQTSNPHIFAAGDCCSFPHPFYGERIRLESWRTAQEQAMVAATNMLGQTESYDKIPWFWSTQFDLTLQISGLMESGTLSIVRDLGDRAKMLFRLDDQNRMVAAAGVAPGHSIGREIKACERLIQRQIQLDPEALTRPEITLKSML